MTAEVSLSEIDLPVGAVRFIGDISKVLRCTFEDAVEHLCSNSEILANYLGSNAERRANYRLSVAKSLGEKETDILSLSGECHLDGSSVCINRRSNIVCYSINRAKPKLFFVLSELYANEIGCPVFGRSINVSHGIIQRPFVEEWEIDDVAIASANAGYLLALAWYTSTTDLHVQNVIFSGDIPYVLDDECVCHPLRQEQIRILHSNRQHYPFSPFRTILIQERQLGRRKSESGFNALLKKGIDGSAFRDAVFEGLNFFRQHNGAVYETIVEYCSKGEQSRYLVRGTEFYDLCIYRICSALATKDDQGIDTIISDLFLEENQLFPGVRSCFDSEVSALKRGEVPYILLSMKDGHLMDGATGCVIGSVTPVPDWMALHTSTVLSFDKSSIEDFLLEVTAE